MKNNLEKIFIEVLDLVEKNYPKDEILNFFPEYQKEIEEILRVIEKIKKEREKISPSRKLLSKILSEIDLSSITKLEKDRYYISREEPKRLKGRLSILELFNIERVLSSMSKKAFFFLAVVVIVAIIGGIFWFSQQKKEIVLPKAEDLSYETESFSKDITDLKILEEDESLDTLEEDLSAIAGEIPLEKELSPTKKFDVGDIENLEKELAVELEGILNDLSDLEGYESDTSLADLEGSLSGW